MSDERSAVLAEMEARLVGALEGLRRGALPPARAAVERMELTVLLEYVRELRHRVGARVAS